MPITEKPWDYQCDDITAVTLLRSDENIELSYVEPQDDATKRTKNTHCVWHLAIQGYTAEEITQLLDFFRKFGGKRGKTRKFTYICPKCRLDWIDDGPCSDECSGRLPDFYLFDEVKRIVIQEKRKAQEELATEKGESSPYEHD